ncbi:shikimate dehydrogenase [Rhizobium rhizogenes]|uniref:Shikimate dehydrogenase (NADP(+)) n=3 Tax=Rhizobiaceae TaxID=82115 RepID=A0AA44F2A5_AGRTU|nr:MULTISPECIES: shikimate dehydrogenase [Rhizobium/Agrobacterium group]MBO9111418.1 shikimate dehydrogenase [Agrobacterium sp. S2/73]NSL23796.1 shikimate dehydrogenase [Agrobacterium tumefaciens]NSY61439.1 shikimate dehydrogenase [Agrobacterium tumefaciens]NSY92982.1 shikimate dehydrogenase [Agrobacterium tumefaciens]NSZ86742.1 shikimate dehydrogenase [Agrobacterium tumefaciens]
MTDTKSFKVGLIGADIQLSKSPALHMREGAAHGLDYSYELVDVVARKLPESALPDLLNELESRGFAGTNITHPFKQAVLPHLHELSDDARMLGAVNTVVFKDGRRIGHNTDWYGFYESFMRGLPDAKRDRALLVGAGGAGVAVAHAALKLGITHLDICDRDFSRADHLAAELNARFGEGHAFAVKDPADSLPFADGLIHATPMGMPAHPGMPVKADLLEQRHWVADIVYMPLVTELLATAAQKGCRTLPGGGMTVFQAVGAFRLFCGREPDAERMTAHFTEICTKEGVA